MDLGDALRPQTMKGPDHDVGGRVQIGLHGRNAVAVAGLGQQMQAVIAAIAQDRRRAAHREGVRQRRHRAGRQRQPRFHRGRGLIAEIHEPAPDEWQARHAVAVLRRQGDVEGREEIAVAVVGRNRLAGKGEQQVEAALSGRAGTALQQKGIA